MNLKLNSALAQEPLKVLQAFFPNCLAIKFYSLQPIKAKYKEECESKLVPKYSAISKISESLINNFGCIDSNQ